MTVNTTDRKAGPFHGDNLTQSFPFDFKVFDKAHLRVVYVDADGSDSDLAYATHYTVSLNADQENNPGGTVTLKSALPGGTKLFILSAEPAVQPTELNNMGGFFPKTIEARLDYITILIQNLMEQMGRALKLGVPHGAADSLLGPAAKWAGKFLWFDDRGRPEPATPITEVLTAGLIGSHLYPRTADEIAAGKTPTHLEYPPGDPRRWGKTVSEGVVTLLVPSDFPTLQQALDLGARTPIPGVVTEIRMETGFAPTAGIFVSDANVGHVHIVADDAIVTVSPEFDGHFMEGVRSVMPRLGCLVDLTEIGGAGVYCRDGSRVIIDRGAGVIRAGRNGLWVHFGSHAMATGSIWDGALGDSCIVANNASYIEARDSSAKNHKGGNETTELNAVWAINGSTINFRAGNATGAVRDAVRADPGSTINALFADASNAGRTGFICQGGLMVCRDAVADGCAARGLHALNGGLITALRVSANNCGERAILAINGGQIYCENSSAENAGFQSAYEAQDGGRVHCERSVGSCLDGVGFRVSNGGILTTGGEGVTGTLSQQPNVYTREGVIFMGGPLPTYPSADETYTASEIADASHPVNTEYKRPGKCIWDVSNRRMLRAWGPEPTDRWDVVDGSEFVTPS